MNPLFDMVGVAGSSPVPTTIIKFSFFFSDSMFKLE